MRLRIGAAMAKKGGRSALVAVEVRERRAADGHLEHQFVVGAVERVTPFTVEACRERLASMVNSVADLRPCVIVDVGTPQGLALHQSLRGSYSPDVHRPHAYPGTGDRAPLFAAFLQAYTAGRVRFEPGLKHRADLDRALVFFLGAGVSKHGVELDSEDDALVVALGLAMTWPKHGGRAEGFEADAMLTSGQALDKAT